MKVLHIVGQIGIGGGEKQLCELIATSPDTIDHNVFYFNDSKDDEGLRLYDRRGVRYTRIQRNRKRPVKFLWDFSQAIKQERPDIVHCWLFSANIWGRLAAILAGHKKIIVTFRSGILGHPRFMRVLELLTQNRVYYLANSRACAAMTASRAGINVGKFHVINNGVDLARFQTPSTRHKLHKELNLNPETTLITMVGRLTKAKNYPMLLKTAQHCKQNGWPVHFCVVGHGELESDIKQMAAALNVDEMVTFLGLRSDIAEVLNASDIFYFTSNWEGFPNALLEAMAAGLPVITTDFEGVRELVAGPEVGTIVPRNDADAAAVAIGRYLDDPKGAKSIGQNAHRFVRATFEMSIMVEKTSVYYHRLLESV